MKTIVLTGGTGDLGRVVVPFLSRDYRCVLLDRSRPAEEQIAPPVYALVLLAGAFAPGATPDDFTRMLEANLMSNLRAIHAALPHLEDGGRIVAISSVASRTRPAGLAAYSAAKNALNATVETLAKDLQPRRITVNALLPSNIDTVPKRQVVADAIALILSHESAAITGQLIALTV
jgi:NAD(P)-dependent dehydrogenase (short-subunit alcohol dehydrogenase family)